MLVFGAVSISNIHAHVFDRVPQVDRLVASDNKALSGWELFVSVIAPRWCLRAIRVKMSKCNSVSVYGGDTKFVGEYTCAYVGNVSIRC